MVKKLFAAVLLTYSSFSFSEVKMDMPVICVPKKELVSYLNDFQEKPLAVAEVIRRVGDAGTTNITLFFLNPTTNTWTVVEKVANDLYCVILSGLNFAVAP